MRQEIQIKRHFCQFHKCWNLFMCGSFHFYLMIFQFAFIWLILPLYATPDLTIVGFLEPEGGIGKVPITIIETLGDQVTSNFIETIPGPVKYEVPVSVKKVLNNPDRSPGKIALLTDVLEHFPRRPTDNIPKECIVKIAYSMLETNLIPNMWVKNLNEEFDAVIVPDEFLLKVYTDSGVNIPIFVLPIPMMLNDYFKHPTHGNSPSIPFIFADCSANKNPVLLIEAFAKAFGNRSDVHLLLRAGRVFDETRKIVNQAVADFGLTNVTLEQGHLALDQYIDRLSSFDCYINLSRGEGFSFIPREALALGLPVIITNNTASKTICDTGFVRAVSSRKEIPPLPIYKELFNNQDCGVQFDCEVKDVVEALIDVYDNYSKFIKKARQGRKWVDRYNCSNSELKRQFITLIKPKKVELSNKNSVVNGIVFTNSKSLFRKYEEIINSYE